MKLETLIRGTAVAAVVLSLAQPGRVEAQGGTCAPLPAGAHLPDLQTVVPQHLNLVNQQQREILRFSNSIANTGTGPLELHPLSEDPKVLNDANQNVYNAGSAATGNLVCFRTLTQAFFF